MNKTVKLIIGILFAVIIMTVALATTVFADDPKDNNNNNAGQFYCGQQSCQAATGGICQGTCVGRQGCGGPCAR